MLLQRSRVVLQSVSGLPSPFKSAQYGLDLWHIRNQFQMRQRSASTIPPYPIPQTYRGLFFPGLKTGFSSHSIRYLSTNRVIRKDSRVNEPEGARETIKRDQNETPLEYKRTEKGEAAKEVDLSARLKERSSPTEKGEVIRLLKLASREWRTLSRTSFLPKTPSKV